MTTTSSAEDLGQTLRTAFDVFESIRELARQWENADPDLFAAFMSAAASAADGRDALSAAPALHAGTSTEPPVVPGSGADADDAADVIAVLATALKTCLTDAARHATLPGDRRACHDAAAAAGRILELMARSDDADAR
jgi:hypothetical protein